MQLSEILTEVQNETRNPALTYTLLVPVLNAIQRQWIQPKARVELAAVTVNVVAGTASYAIGATIYTIRFLTEVKSGVEKRLAELLSEDDVEGEGIRQWAGSLIFQPTPTAARTIKIYGHKVLTAFTVAGTTMAPDIPTDFHDLYVSGASRRLKRRKDDLNPEALDFGGEFLSRLDELETYQKNRKRALSRRRIPARPWT